MSNRRRYEIPEIYPQPKHIILTEGDSELSTDIRLVTSNVLPLQRKAIRSILTGTGVKVVANKKRYVVDVCVQTPADFDLSEVPEAVRQEYYEIEIKGSEITIRAPYQEGTVWAAQTLAAVFRRLQRGNGIPNLIVKDWPTLPVRGVFVENKWGPDRMVLSDWYATIEALAANKLNTLGIGLYGCWGSCRFEEGDKLTEFLMVPVQDHEDICNTHHLRWFSPAQDDWKDETYQPAMNEGDFLADVVNYGRERGVNVVPFVNSLGHNTFFPRMLPELSARDEDGNPAGAGYCLSNPAVREFLERFYGSIIDRYYGGNCDTFHIQLDEIGNTLSSAENPKKVVSYWCQCEACRAHSHESLLQDYVLWLTKMLTDKGVRKVVIWNDMLTRSMQAFDETFVKKLEKAGLKDRLVIDFWGYSNAALDPKRDPEISQKMGIDAWVTPMTCYYDWSTYSYNIPNIDLQMQLAIKRNVAGAVSYAVHNPSHTDHEALLAGYAWEAAPDADSEDYLKRWAIAHFENDARNLLQAISLIREASEVPAFNKCLNYTYTYVGATFPREYPGEALGLLEKDVDGSLAALEPLTEQGLKADQLLVRLLEREGLNEQERDCLRSLRAHAQRIVFLAKTFTWLLTLRRELASGMVKKSQATACAKLYEELREPLSVVEANAPSWLAPAMMMALSRLYAFVGQLSEQLREFGGRKKASSLLWRLAAPSTEEQA